MIVEIWQDTDGYSAFPSDNQSARDLLTPQAKLLRTIVAKTWDEAMTKHHELMGWEPYVPMKERE